MGRRCGLHTAAWVDTGFLVALFARDDEPFASAVAFLANVQRLERHSLWWVVAEASCCLDIPGQVALLDWRERQGVIRHELTVAERPAIRRTLQQYHDLAPDFTDAALVRGLDAASLDDVFRPGG